MGAEGLPACTRCRLHCWWTGPAVTYYIGGADDKLKRKPSPNPSLTGPVVFVLSRTPTRHYSQISRLRCITTYTRHNEYKLECYRVSILFRIESRNAVYGALRGN